VAKVAKFMFSRRAQNVYRVLSHDPSKGAGKKAAEALERVRRERQARQARRAATEPVRCDCGTWNEIDLDSGEAQFCGECRVQLLDAEQG
jgi:membrane protease subunit (stomatin/prohibitin family)